MDEARWSAADVAERAGVGGADVERMVALGILSSDGDGFGPGDVRRVRLAMACERAGLPMDAIAESVREGRLSFAFLDAITYRRWAERSARTYAEVCEAEGIPFESMRATLDAMGFAAMEPGDRIREDELEIVPLLRMSFATGVMDEEWFVRLGRAYADALRRIVQAENEVYHDRFEQPFLEQGMTQGQAMEAASSMAGRVQPAGGPDAARACSAASRSCSGPSTSSSTSRTTSSAPGGWGVPNGFRPWRSSTSRGTRG